jgi:hypothetical protein
LHFANPCFVFVFLSALLVLVFAEAQQPHVLATTTLSRN